VHHQVTTPGRRQDDVERKLRQHDHDVRAAVQLQVIDDNTLTRDIPDIKDMTLTYSRCPM